MHIYPRRCAVSSIEFLTLASNPAWAGWQTRPADVRDVPEDGQFLVRSYSNQFGTRAYKLYVPSRYRRQPLALIVMLHGCTQSPDDFAAGTRMNLRAEAHNCFVAYPAQAASANASKCWNWFRPGDQRARPRRAFANRGHHPPGCKRLLDRPGSGLCCRALGRRRGYGHSGGNLPRPLRSNRRAFRPGLRGGQ